VTFVAARPNPSTSQRGRGNRPSRRTRVRRAANARRCLPLYRKLTTETPLSPGAPPLANIVGGAPSFCAVKISPISEIMISNSKTNSAKFATSDSADGCLERRDKSDPDFRPSRRHLKIVRNEARGKIESILMPRGRRPSTAARTSLFLNSGLERASRRAGTLNSTVAPIPLRPPCEPPAPALSKFSSPRCVPTPRRRSFDWGFSSGPAQTPRPRTPGCRSPADCGV
jgi:hypothetical protein